MQITQYLHDEIGKMAPFVNYSDHVENPLFIWYMKPDYAKTAKWTLYDLQDKLKQGGWMVPAYTLPENIQNYVVMRIVVRQGFSRDMADMLLNDIRDAVASLEKLEYRPILVSHKTKILEVKGSVFTHTGTAIKQKNRNMKQTISVSQIKQAVNEAYDLYKNNQDGKNADYIPYLANIDKNLFGISVCLLDGQIIEVGDTQYRFGIESVSKVHTAILVLRQYGAEKLLSMIGADATGLPFNSIIAILLETITLDPIG